jgi:hypothetical protein
MKAGSDLAAEEGEQHVHLAAFDGAANMAMKAHERPVDGFHRLAGMIPGTEGCTDVSGRPIEFSGQFPSGQFFDSGSGTVTAAVDAMRLSTPSMARS